MTSSAVAAPAPARRSRSCCRSSPGWPAAAGRSPSAPRALILAPTRELAGQIDAALQPLAAAAGLTSRTVFGGVGQNPQVAALRARRRHRRRLPRPARGPHPAGALLAATRSRSPCSTRPTTWPTSASCPRVRRLLGQHPGRRAAHAVLGHARRRVDALVRAVPDQPRGAPGRLGAVAGRDDGPPRAAGRPRAPAAGAGRPDQRARAVDRVHPDQARRQGAGPPAQPQRRAGGRAARQPRPERAHPQPRRRSTPAGRRRWSRPTSPRAASTSTTSRSSSTPTRRPSTRPTCTAPAAPPAPATPARSSR